MNERMERFYSIAMEKGLREAHRDVELTDDEIDRVVELAAEVLGLSDETKREPICNPAPFAIASDPWSA